MSRKNCHWSGLPVSRVIRPFMHRKLSAELAEPAGNFIGRQRIQKAGYLLSLTNIPLNTCAVCCEHDLGGGVLLDGLAHQQSQKAQGGLRCADRFAAGYLIIIRARSKSSGVSIPTPECPVTTILILRPDSKYRNCSSFSAISSGVGCMSENSMIARFRKA